MTIEQRIEDPAADQFPVGMRVLAVDDDPTCLLLLERLLRKCNYHVTTRTHAIAALNLLRENKNRFDLVISDVHMPDMDGFKLLEFVGLEMDLPVIMLSANGDPNLVMKGITHGACDYLLKPVRIEELQIIWQHVIRKKKVDPNTSVNGLKGNGEGGQGGVGNRNNGDQKSNKKRKDQIEDEDEDQDENGLDNDDPSAQKKPRVVWSIELHRKFVAAVNHLGIDKAVPKRILELMNVEKLTRENVASHLQKYRLYLRRISCVQSQQANMVAAFGNTDTTSGSYMRISSPIGMGSFNTLSGSSQFQTVSFNSFRPNAMLGRLNSSASLGIQRLSSRVQVNHSQLSGFTGHASDQGMPTSFPGNPSGCILKGMPMSFEFDQLQDNNFSRVSDIEELAGFPVSSGLPEGKVSVRSVNGSQLTASNNTMMFQELSMQASSQLGIQNQVSAVLPSISPDLSSRFTECARGNDKWPIAVQSSAVQTNSYAPYHGSQHVNTYMEDGSSIGEMPLYVADYQYQAAHPSIDAGQAPYGQDTISIPRMTNSDGIPKFSTVEQPTYIDSQVEQSDVSISMLNSTRGYHQLGHGKSNTTVGSLEDLVSSMMK